MFAVLEREGVRLIESFGTHVAIKLLLLFPWVCHVYPALIVLLDFNTIFEKLIFLLIIIS